MDQLIPLINKLQDVFNAIGGDPVDLPQIVVVGSQSSGKSSVLENIVGRDFLPRGVGIVTRRPLVLQLINLSRESKSEADKKFEEWGEFLHKKNELFYDFNAIRQEIQNETDKVTGTNKGVSSLPINLKIYSPHVVNLTLVDLPGITKVPVGDQPTDIELQIRKMILSYISKKNSIILAVTAANTDLANSDALQLAKEVDPEGTRVIGVITKIDLMDKGTDAFEVLTGKVIPLKLGYVGVVNRSQQDIISKVSIREALKNEALYFNNSPIYRSLASRCGTPYLSKMLNKVLIQHIRECLPDLRAKINKMMAESQAELLSYGDPLFDSGNSQGALLLSILTRLTNEYITAVDGTSQNLSLEELHGGARINFIFHEIYGNHVASMTPQETLTESEIRTALRNSTGPRSSLFVPEGSFDLLAKRLIRRLEDPSLQCVDYVYDELQKIIFSFEKKEDLQRFANLRQRVLEIANELLQNCRIPTKKMISNLIQIELSYINNNHPDFVGSSAALFSSLLAKLTQNQQQVQQQQFQMIPAPGPGPVPTPSPAPTQMGPQGNQHSHSGGFGFFSKTTSQPQVQPKPAAPSSFMNQPSAAKQEEKSKQNALTAIFSTQQTTKSNAHSAPRLAEIPHTIRPAAFSDKERFDVELISSLLASYFDIVKKNLRDSVPKSIMFFLVNASKEGLQNELVKNLYKAELFDELFEETSVVAAKRKACQEMLTMLKRAHDIVNEVRDWPTK